MNKLLKTSVLIAAFAPAVTLAQAVNGDNEVTISGTGGSDKDFDATVFGLTGSYGKYISDMGQAGVRQNITISDTEGEETDFDGATVIYYDHHFNLDRLRPFVGLNVGYNYGDTTEETFSAGPELGLKYYVLEKTFIQGMVQYQFLFEDADEIDDRSDDGRYYYSVGMGYNF